MSKEDILNQIDEYKSQRELVEDMLEELYHKLDETECE